MEIKGISTSFIIVDFLLDSMFYRNKMSFSSVWEASEAEQSLLDLCFWLLTCIIQRGQNEKFH